ncbi:MAG: hypothetical protein CL927_00340 [Deltaproteobacteria bacterium]|nr:hypothetical protein [Deltaproteobacteria bacterium]HCH62616.1 hypothetical protein [Deltaproteobacteria bacterium]
MKHLTTLQWCARWVVVVGVVACAGRKSPLSGYVWSDPSARTGVEEPAHAVLKTYAAAIDGSVRAAALEVLVRAGAEPGGGPYGIAAIWDPEPWVQRAAVRGLVARGAEPASLERLAVLAARPQIDPYVRCRAALLLPGEFSESVGQSVDEGWVGAPLWQALPCATAAAVHGSEPALAVVREALSSGAVALDPEFMRILSQQSLEGMDTSLREGLASADELARPAYVSALLVRGQAAALDELRTSLVDPDPLVRMEAVLSLSAVDTPATSTMLNRTATERQTPEASVASLVVAARNGANFRVFEEAWLNDNRDVRRAAIVFGAEHVLRQEARGSRSARKRLEGLLAEALVDADPTTSTEALRQVGRVAMHNLEPVVSALLNDTEADAHVRIAAAAAWIRLESAQ